MIKILSVLIPLVLLIGHDGFSQEVPLLCESQTATAKTRCRLETVIIGESQKFEANFDIAYRFACRGHATGLVFQTDLGLVPVDFTREQKILRITGNSGVSIVDQDPNKTYRATLAGDCKIEINSVKKFPSFNEIRRWQSKAETLTSGLRDAMDSLQLARAYADIFGMTEGTLTNLEKNARTYVDDAIRRVEGYEETGLGYFTDTSGRILSVDEMTAKGILFEWEDLTFERPIIADMVKVMHYCAAKLSGIPPIMDPSALQRAFTRTKDGLIAAYKRKLLARIDEATKFLAFVAPYQEQADDDFKRAMTTLKDLAKAEGL